MPKGVPSVVWTSLIGHAFLDAYEHFENERYLKVAVSACEHILRDLATHSPTANSLHQLYSRTKHIRFTTPIRLGASLLARTYSHTGNESYRALAQKAIQYTAKYQTSRFILVLRRSANLHWVDNFHTAYVLDCFKHYVESTGDDRFEKNCIERIRILEEDVLSCRRNATILRPQNLPLDIQCCSQAIDTLVFFNDRDPESLPLALKVANGPSSTCRIDRLFLLPPVFALARQQDADAALGTSDDALCARRTLQIACRYEQASSREEKSTHHRRKRTRSFRYARVEGGSSLHENGYEVTVLCPAGKGYTKATKSSKGSTSTAIRCPRRK